VLIPPALRPGDLVRVVAPSGPFDRALVLRGLGWLASRYRVRFGRGLFAKQGFLAGPDAERLEELNAALRDPEARAVVAARGGYGLTRIALAVDVRALLEHPKWIAGFSDITALHVELQRAKIASIHGHNVAGLGRGDDAARRAFTSVLEAPTAPRRLYGLAAWHGGSATGPLIGGNLTVLFACAAAGRLSVPSGAILLIEDIGEAPYRIDRMLSALLSGGALDRVAAVVVGDFVDCVPGRYGVPAESVLRERLAELRVPVVAGAPIGHGRRNDPVVLGANARVDAGAGTVVFPGTG
jgi:muramoyltetrapeptide carboxypeptidase